MISSTSNKLEVQIDIRDEHDLKISSNDLFRPRLKEIGNSLTRIINHFCPSDPERILILPQSVPNQLNKIKDCLHKLFKDSQFFKNDVQRGFVYLCQSLVPVLSISTNFKPCNCDLLIILPNQPVTVLSLVDLEYISEELVKYNVSVARGTVVALGKFMNECVNVLNGVLDVDKLINPSAFDSEMNALRKKASLFVTPRSLSMTIPKFEKVLRAFWAASAVTTSVIRKEEEGACLRFLTKDQCIVLLENLDREDVRVGCVPQSGRSTLMLEVAKRLSLLQETAIICDAKVKNTLGCIYPLTFSWDDGCSLHNFKNFVIDRDVFELQRGKCWHFSKIADGEVSNRFEVGNMSVHEDLSLNQEKQRIKTFLAITGDETIKSANIPRGTTQTTHSKHGSKRMQEPVPDQDLDTINEIRNKKKLIAQLKAKISYLEQVKEEMYQHHRQVTMEGKTASRKRKPDDVPPGETPEPSIEEGKPQGHRDIDTVKIIPRGTFPKRLKTDFGDEQFLRKNHTRTLRTMEYGHFSSTVFKSLLENIRLEDKTMLGCLSQMSARLEIDDGKIHMVGELETLRSLPISCPDIRFAPEAANRHICRVTEDGSLTNVTQKPVSGNRSGFGKYRGTRGTLRIPHSREGSRFHLLPKYWETHIDGWLKKRVLVWRTFFEISLVEESQLDAKYLASNQARSWSITVADCTIHEGICTKAYEEGNLEKCIANPLLNETNTLESHKYGTVIDTKRGRIAFLDLNRGRVIHKYNVQLKEVVYPLFGMWSYPEDFTVVMNVVGGKDIKMTEEKLNLINRALS